MASKIVTTLGRQVVRKMGKNGLTKIIEKVDEPFATFNREIFGIKPLNVGEMEELRCYSRHPNSTSKCNELGTRVRREYHRTGTYKPYDKKK